MSKKKRKKSSEPKPIPAAASGAEQAEEDPEARAARRAAQKAEWAAQKKKAERQPVPAAVWAWIGGGVLLLVVAVGVGYLIFGGGDDSSTVAGPSATPDARVAGLPIAKTVDVEADDDGQAVNPRFIPAQVTGLAGEVIEIRVINVGSVAHNLRVAGLDAEYDTRDDFLSDPGTIMDGEEGRVLVKIDEPGSYPFRCDFHVTQVGELILN
jgi:plastocyanin